MNNQNSSPWAALIQQILGGQNTPMQTGAIPQIQQLKQQQQPMDDMINQTLQQPQAMQQQQQGAGVVGSMMQGQSLGNSLSKSKLGQFAKMFLGI